MAASSCPNQLYAELCVTVLEEENCSVRKTYNDLIINGK